jgi:hypothetical protein
MNNWLDRNVVWLARISLILGTLSFGLVVISFIPIIKGRLTGGADAMMFFYGILALVPMLGGLFLGSLGLIISLIALRRKTKEAGENRNKRLAVTGLVLSGLGVAIVCILLSVTIFLSSTKPPLPPLVTPVSHSTELRM